MIYAQILVHRTHWNAPEFTPFYNYNYYFYFFITLHLRTKGFVWCYNFGSCNLVVTKIPSSLCNVFMVVSFSQGLYYVPLCSWLLTILVWIIKLKMVEEDEFFCRLILPSWNGAFPISGFWNSADDEGTPTVSFHARPSG